MQLQNDKKKRNLILIKNKTKMEEWRKFIPISAKLVPLLFNSFMKII